MSSRRRGDGVLLLLGSAAVAMSVAAAVLEYRRRRLRRLRRGCRDHGERFADALCLREKVRRGHPSDEVAGSLLFLGRVLVEKKQFQNSERVTMQALDVSRKAFGDDGEMTKQCMSAMVGLRQRVQREKA